MYFHFYPSLKSYVNIFTCSYMWPIFVEIYISQIWSSNINRVQYLSSAMLYCKIRLTQVVFIYLFVWFKTYAFSEIQTNKNPRSWRFRTNLKSLKSIEDILVQLIIRVTSFGRLSKSLIKSPSPPFPVSVHIS